MRDRFVAPLGRMSAVLGDVSERVSGGGRMLRQRVHQAALPSRLSSFQWAVCILLAALAIVIGFCLLSIRSNTVELNANIRDTTKALADMRADLVKSIDGVHRKMADTNQKLSDLVVELDDLIAEQHKFAVSQSQPPLEPRPAAKPAGQTNARARASELVVHRRQSKR